jgi:hypothetical protein
LNGVPQGQQRHGHPNRPEGHRDSDAPVFLTEHLALCPKGSCSWRTRWVRV